MPQFELANFLPQLVWLAIFFAILYFGVVRLTLPKLGRVMTAREDKVTGDLDSAERAKAEADRLTAEHEAGVTVAQERARAALTAARHRATAAMEAALAISGRALHDRAEAAQASLEAARTNALATIEGVAADAAADIVERLTGRRPDDGAAARAARTALA